MLPLCRLVWLACVGVIVASCQREPYELRRPWAASDLASLTFGGTTMPARRLGRAPSAEALALGPVRSGELLFSAALEGADGARASIAIDESARDACVVEGASARWHACRLPVRRDAEDVRFHVRVDGPADAALVLSAPLLRRGTSRASNVIVVLTDALRFDQLVSYDPQMALGTALDRLAHDGVVFERVYSSSSWTRTAVATLLTGLDASTHNVLGRDDVLAATLDRLPQALQRAGYRTVAWSTNPNILPVWGFETGFDVFHDLGAGEWTSDKVDAADVLRAVGEALAEPDQPPTFVYAHLMDPHAPYQPREEDRQAVASDPRFARAYPGGAERPEAAADFARYVAEVRGMDRELGAFFDGLRARGLYEPAAILVLADHGEEFLDHGGTRHGRTLYDEVLRIPMILKLPGNTLAGTRVASEIGIADAAPTLLGALGVGGLEHADGRNLWDAAARRFRDEPAMQSAVLKLDTHHQAALVTQKRKLILDYHGHDRMFDLANDPRERHDLLPQAEGDATALRALLDQRIARQQAGWHVRVCGGDRPLRLRLRIALSGAARGALLEADDHVRSLDAAGGAAAYEADFELEPRPSERVVDGRMWRGMRPDEDEVLASADAPSVLITAPSGEALRYAVGTGEERAAAPEIVARASDPATRVRPSAAVDCDPNPWDASGDGAEWYVRLWYVAPAERREETEVDRGVQERLRALGYQW